MNIFFYDPDEVRLPPEEVRLKKVEVIPKADGGRVKIRLELTPFQKRPNISVMITAQSGKEVANTTILETMLTQLEITMHLRGRETGDHFVVETIVYYQMVPQPTETEVEIQLPEPMIVDKQHTMLVIP